MIRLKLTERQLKEELLVWQMKERINRYKIELLLSEGGSCNYELFSNILHNLSEKVSDIQVEIALVEAFLKDKGVKMYSGKEALLIVKDIVKKEYSLEAMGFQIVLCSDSLTTKEKEETKKVGQGIRNLPMWYTRFLERCYDMPYKEIKYNVTLKALEINLGTESEYSVFTTDNKGVKLELLVEKGVRQKIKEAILPYKNEYSLGGVSINTLERTAEVALVKKEQLDVDFSIGLDLDLDFFRVQYLEEERQSLKEVMDRLKGSFDHSGKSEYDILSKLQLSIMEDLMEVLEERINLI